MGVVQRELEFVTPNFQTLQADTAQTIYNSIGCSNGEQATGGEEAESIASIKINAINNMSSQMRCVTLQDYQVRVMSMPSQFGTIFRSFARKNPNNNLGVELIMITRNAQGQLSLPNNVIINNVEKYIQQYKSFSDSVFFTPGRIINIGINFTIVPSPNANFSEALMSTILLLQRAFSTNLTNFNDSIVISEIIALIQSQKTVLSVPDFNIVNKTASVGSRNYSGAHYDIRANTKA